jgi:surface antigen
MSALFGAVLLWAAVSAEPVVPANDGKPLFIYPEVFGQYNLSSCGDAPACGTVMSTFNGISAKSNGGNQCTGSSCGGYGDYGYHYQCVELAQRYFGELYGTAPIWYGNAIDLCHTYPAGVSLTSSPIKGDLVVFKTSSGYGHVAVVTGFDGSTINVMEQNSSPSGTNSYGTSNVVCYLHADKNSGGGSYCNAAGWYCGNDNLEKDPNHIYYCDSAGGAVEVDTPCGMTCVTMPHGFNDECTDIGSCEGLHGDYCGADKVSGDEALLYQCRSGTPAGAVHCPNGCVVAEAGMDDYCK